MTLIDVTAGTDERTWRAWPEPDSWPVLPLNPMAGRRIVLLAAHPDDEVLAAGGMLSMLASRGADVVFVWATDGEASHPRSTAPTARRLAVLRRAESAAALRLLGHERATRIHLGLPDGALAAASGSLVEACADLIGPDDVVITLWSGDGHPDHEACARAALQVSRNVLELPLWVWHWAAPADPRVPWHRARRLDLTAAARRAKTAAVAGFRSQLQAIGPDADRDGAVLTPRVLAHFTRDHEVVFA